MSSVLNKRHGPGDTLQLVRILTVDLSFKFRGDFKNHLILIFIKELFLMVFNNLLLLLFSWWVHLVVLRAYPGSVLILGSTPRGAQRSLLVGLCILNGLCLVRKMF